MMLILMLMGMLMCRLSGGVVGPSISRHLMKHLILLSVGCNLQELVVKPVLVANPVVLLQARDQS